MNYLKNALKSTVLILLLVFVIDFFVCRLILNYGFKYDTSEFNLQRFSVPYIEFTGKPFVLDHNEFGYRGKSIKDTPDSAFRVLFFGGSTGYYGNPTIATLLEKKLKTDLDKDIFVINCSVVSSNHHQHVHALIEQIMNHKIDMVIFYGGYNENIQSLYYDPRPGYPFNFYYKNECARWRLNLMKYSAICGELEKRYRLISGIRSLRKSYEDNKVAWFKSIEANYFETLQKANSITTQLIKNNNGEPCKFIGFYQPYKVPDSYLNANKEIKQHIAGISYLQDISACLDSINALRNVYIDDVHVVQAANVVIAEKIAVAIEKNLQ